MRLALVMTVSYFLDFLNLMILIRVFLSWFSFNPDNRLIRVVYQLTEPVLEPFRKLTAKLGLNTGMVDFSPFISLLVLYYVVKPLLFTLIATFF
jgi:YggT family protein